MRILQIEVNRPDFNAVTRAAVIATTLFLVLLGGCALVGYRLTPELKTLMLAGMFWGLLSQQMGINPLLNWRHTVVNIASTSVLYLAVRTVFSCLNY